MKTRIERSLLHVHSALCNLFEKIFTGKPSAARKQAPWMDEHANSMLIEDEIRRTNEACGSIASNSVANIRKRNVLNVEFTWTGVWRDTNTSRGSAKYILAAMLTSDD